MATLAEQFKKALTNIEPDADADSAKKAHEEVRKVLVEDSKLKGWGINPLLIGSYAREVSILRVKDVDLFGRLESPPEDLRPGAALDEFERVLLEAFPKRVEKQHRSFKVDFPNFGLSVDAVPARVYGDHWEIPSRPDARAKWIETNPIKLGDITTSMNQNPQFQFAGKGIYVPIVKLVRQVRRAQLAEDPPGGLFFEILSYWVFKNDMTSQKTVAGYLSKTIRGISTLLEDVVDNGLCDPTLEGKLITTKADEADLKVAADVFLDAAELAENACDETDECKSANMWAKLLGKNDNGEVFELPEHCAGNESKQTSKEQLRTPGSNRVPAGTDRFA